MKVALVGYGKMGKAIEAIADPKQFDFNLKITSQNIDEFKNCIHSDVVIDFSTPDVILKHIDFYIQNNLKAVIGTTGWHDSINQIKDQVSASKSGLVYASNFSIGVTLFFAIADYASKIINQKPYDVSIHETHHTEKLDAPSGTAITLAEKIVKNDSTKHTWALAEQNNSKEILNIFSHRKENVVGQHIVTFENQIDEIHLTHNAKNREGFAKGALLAAEWIQNKNGFYQMKDVLNL